MKYLIASVFVLLLNPAGAYAATPSMFSAARSLHVASSTVGNAYTGGASVIVTAPISGDLTALGGSVIAAAPVTGDELLIGGTVSARAPVTGDLRALGGRINILESVGGDLTLVGVSVESTGRPRGSVFVIAANTTLSNGAAGPVIIYGNNIALAGDFASDVTVISTGRLSLSPSTVIHGGLRYEAPEAARIPASTTITGGIQYRHVSYLPSANASRLLEIMSIGFFLLVRVLGAVILAGLLAGLFPRLAEELTYRAYHGPVRSILLATLLGFAILVATPILLILLALTFVGIGVAVLLGIAYALIVMLALVYSGILVGSLVVRRFRRRDMVLWRDGVLGMLALSFVSLVPFIGPTILVALTMFCAGALLLIFFRFAFSQEEHTQEMI
jgi:hypothetical protein